MAKDDTKPQAIGLKRKDEAPSAAERTTLTTWLAAKGMKNLAGISAGKSRGAIVAECVWLCRAARKATKDDAAVKTLKIAPAEWDRAVAFRDAEDKAIEDLGCWDRT